MEELFGRIEKMILICNKDVLNADECAIYLGITKQSLYNMVNKREIPYYKHGNKDYFKKSEIDEFLLTERIEPMSEILSKAETYCLTNKRKICR